MAYVAFYIRQDQDQQRWDSYFLLFKSNSLLITITYNKKYFVTVTYYLENKYYIIYYF